MAESDVFVNEKKCLTDTEKGRIRTVFRKKFEKRTYLECSKIPEYLKDIGIDYREYWSGLRSLVNEVFEEDYKIETTPPKKNCQSVPILMQKKAVLIPDIVLTEEILQKIRKKLDKAIVEKAFYDPGRIPDLLKGYGISNYKAYASTIAQFIEWYLGDYFEVKKNITINNKLHTTLIVAKERKEPVPEPVVDIFSELDRLYEAKEYVKFLTSAEFASVSPDKLPTEYFEKALTCAARILLGESCEQVKMNLFQKEVLRINSGSDFLKTWKNDTGFGEEIMVSCGESSLAKLTVENEKGILCQLLNNLGHCNKQNSNYAGLSQRFQECCNEIQPYIFTIRGFAAKSTNAIEKCVVEYCNWVKELKKSNIYGKLDEDKKMGLFPQFIMRYQQEFLKERMLPNNLRTNIISVFVENNSLELLEQVVEIIDPDSSCVNRRLVHLTSHYEEWTEEAFVELMRNNVSRQLFQKCCSMAWGQQAQNVKLNADYLRLLAWIIKYDAYTSIDEILRYRIPNEFKKSDKWNMILMSLCDVCDLAKTDATMYNLAAYIAKHLCQDMNEENMSDAMRENLNTWEEFSQQYFEERTAPFKTLTDENRHLFVELFQVFEMDRKHYNALQAQYADLISAQYNIEGMTQEGVEVVLKNLYEECAYEAYSRIYLRALGNGTALQDVYLSQYIESLTNLNRFAELISFLKQNEKLTKEKRDAEIEKVLCENFRVHCLSPEAYSVFNDDFTVENAIEILLKNFMSSKYASITALIGLYAKTNEWEKASYLYTIYQSKAESGYARFYSKFRGKISGYLGSPETHYEVIHAAFFRLTPKALVEFMTWAKQIIIPGFQTYNPTHVYGYLFDGLLASPTNMDPWKRFMDHLVKRPNLNAWMICVCDAVLSQCFGTARTNHTRNAIETIVEQEISENGSGKVPYNLLAYTCSYIMESGDVHICQKLQECLRVSAVKERIIFQNPWYNTYQETMDRFMSYCVDEYQRTGNNTFYELISAIDGQLSPENIADLLQSVEDKQYLFKKISVSYLTESNIEDMITLLNDGKWANLTYREAEVLKLLRIIYSENEELMIKQPLFFENESKVARFKLDCARILKDFPKNNALREFEESCMNRGYRFLVYSYVFGCLYERDIYNKYVIRYFDFENETERLAYISFLNKTYSAQLSFNSNYDFFYKKWRYMKQYLAKVLQDGKEADDTDILSLMEQNKHTEAILAETYFPFKQEVDTFLRFENLSLDERNCFLYGLMVGQMSEYLSNYGDTLVALSEEQTVVMKRLILFLDYREVNCGFYKQYLQEITGNGLERVLTVANVISDYAYDTLNALKNCTKKEEALKVFCDAAMQSPAVCVNKILRLEKERFEELSDMVIPLICSRQFSFQIYGKMRSIVVTKGQIKFSNQFEKIASYLDSKGYKEALAVYYYLCALNACMTRDRAELDRVLSEHDIVTDIPEQWKNEAQRILQYAKAPNQDRFVPDRAILDNSKKSNRSKYAFNFVKKLVPLFEIKKTRLSKENIVEKYEKFVSRNIKAWDKAALGLEILWNYPKEEVDLGTGDKLPSYQALALEIGVLISSNDISLSSEDKLAVITELYENKQSFGGKQQTMFVQLAEQCTYIVQRKLGLKTWISYHTQILNILQEMNREFDFEELCKRILEPSVLFLEEECSVEKRYHGLKKLLMEFHGLESIYARNVQSAVQAEIRSIEEGIRLHVDIVNQNDKITDGYVYFQIENIGNRTISLTERNSKVMLKVSSYPEVTIPVKNICDLRPHYVTGERGEVRETKANENLEITIKVFVNDILVSKAHKELMTAEEAQSAVVTASVRYDVDKAVTTNEALFGRELEKEHLSAVIPNGKTVIYGPSRIGKTSLLNWVRNSLAEQKENVVSVLYGGEDIGKLSDYVKDFRKEDEEVPPPVPYENGREMAEYLLVDTILNGFEDFDRLKVPKNNRFTNVLEQELIKVLENRSLSVRKRYSKVNQLLKKAGMELWILLDEFQQVVEKWRPETGEAFVTACESLSANSNIKLIICGSDDLLKHMVLEDDSIWRKIIPPNSRVSVGPLAEEAFVQMIQSEESVRKSGLSYSKSALKALYTYTGGVALYGKEICNSILDDIRVYKEKFAGRNVIYTSDIAEATQRLLKKQESEENIVNPEGIRRIYDAVTKNLDKDTDMQYLWFMAKWMYENPEYEGFPIRIFKERRLLNGEQKLKDSLAIASARGIIRELSSEREADSIYVFNTLFYYNAFLGNAKKSLDESKIFKKASAQNVERAEKKEEDPYTSKKLTQYLTSLSVAEQKSLLGSMVMSVDSDVKKELKELVGKNTTISGEKVTTVEGSNTENTNIQVNIQQITNTLMDFKAGSLSGAQLLQKVNELPRLDTYYTPNLGITEKNALLEEQRMEHGMNAIVDAYSDSLLPVIDQEDETEESDYKRYHVKELLGISEGEFEKIYDSMEDWSYEHLRMTLYLHYFFSQAQEEEKGSSHVDYSPVSIMYCKLLESLLKEHHRIAYAKTFKDLKTNISVRNKKTRKNEFLTYYELMTGRQQHRITIGTFSHLIKKDPKAEEHCELLGKAYPNEYEESTKKEWQKHAAVIDEVLEIRNLSAHGQKDHRVTKEQQDKLNKLLFEEGKGELLRIPNLVKEYK